MAKAGVEDFVKAPKDADGRATQGEWAWEWFLLPTGSVSSQKISDFGISKCGVLVHYEMLAAKSYEETATFAGRRMTCVVFVPSFCLPDNGS